MILLMLALGNASVSSAPPTGLQFGFGRMASFKSRAKENRCSAGELDRELEIVRKHLTVRYGEKAFEWLKIPKSPASKGGDCYSVTMVYRTNLADFKKEAAAALATPTGN